MTDRLHVHTHVNFISVQTVPTPAKYTTSLSLHNLKKSPAHEDLAPCCFATGMGADVGAVDAPQGAAAWETGLAMGEGASERGLGDGDLGALPAPVPAL